jgi:hypothetical protein
LSTGSNLSPSRPPPELVASIVLEGGTPTVQLLAFSDGDERRFRAWLRANPQALSELLLAILDAEAALLDERRDGAA